MVGARSAPTAVMCEGADTNRTGAGSGLYLRPRTSRQAAFGGQSNGRSSFACLVILVHFVVEKTPFVFVSSFLL